MEEKQLEEGALSIQEVQRIMNMSRGFLFTFIKSGELPAEQYGRGKNKIYRIRREDLEAWRKRNRVKT